MLSCLQPDLRSLSGLRKMKIEASTCSLSWPTMAIATTPASNLQEHTQTHSCKNLDALPATSLPIIMYYPFQDPFSPISTLAIYPIKFNIISQMSVFNNDACMHAIYSSKLEVLAHYVLLPSHTSEATIASVYSSKESQNITAGSGASTLCAHA